MTVHPLAEEVEDTRAQLTARIGTPAYTAPEIVLSEKTRISYNKSVDVYSFGMVLYEFWTGMRPFDETKYAGQDIQDLLSSSARPTIPTNCPPVYAKLMERCWDNVPSGRPTFQSIVKTLQAVYETMVDAV